MTVLVDTYVTLEEAEAYISSHYRTNNKARIRWDGISGENKAVLLVQACAEMDSLPFRGRKATSGQALSFPRLPLQYGQSQEPPTKVKHAQIELALWLSDDERQAGQDKRQDLQNQGMASFSIGDLSENYIEGAVQKPAPLACPKCAALLAPYLNGGYAMC